MPVSSALTSCECENEPHDDYHGGRHTSEVDQSEELHGVGLPVARPARPRSTDSIASISTAESLGGSSFPASSVEALLLSLPDLSGALASYSAEELHDLFAAFDLQVSYDKP